MGVEKSELKNAVEKATYELNNFAKELIQENLNIDIIDHLLIWDDGKHD